jgi:hypothetical protein
VSQEQNANAIAPDDVLLQGAESTELPKLQPSGTEKYL